MIWVCLPRQSAAEKHSHDNNKKPPTYFCAPHEFLNEMSRPCLTTINSCYFYYSVNKPSTWSRSLICVSCSVHVISTCCVRKGSSPSVILIIHESTRSENPITWKHSETRVEADFRALKAGAGDCGCKEGWYSVEHMVISQGWMWVKTQGKLGRELKLKLEVQLVPPIPKKKVGQMSICKLLFTFCSSNFYAFLGGVCLQVTDFSICLYWTELCIMLYVFKLVIVPCIFTEQGCVL